MKQKFCKTPTSQRKVYKYYDANDRCVATICPDAASNVTEVHIKLLHSLDDAEVYNNRKNCSTSPVTTKSDGTATVNGSHWVLSLDWMQDESQMGYTEHRKLLAQAYRSEEQRRRDVRRELLYEAVGYLDGKQQTLFRQYYLDEMTQTAIAQQEHVSVPAIHKRLKKLEAELKDIIFKKILLDG